MRIDEKQEIIWLTFLWIHNRGNKEKRINKNRSRFYKRGKGLGQYNGLSKLGEDRTTCQAKQKGEKRPHNLVLEILFILALNERNLGGDSHAKEKDGG